MGRSGKGGLHPKDAPLRKPLHYVKLPRSPEEWEAFFYFAGVMFGDGSQDKIANNDVEVYEELKKLSVLGVAVKRVERTTSYEIELTNGKTPC